jgi:alkanesulfonate monooxygenase SsuD/methylene tetrahydromethanopterin reductase-like flavin-dependent oxidoreductase (luciferase family)
VLEGLVQERELVCSLEIDGFVASTGPGVDRLVRRVQQDRANHEDLAPVFERGLIGTPEDAAGRLVELVEAGVDQVVVALHDPHDRDALEALAEATRVARQTLDDRSA